MIKNSKFITVYILLTAAALFLHLHTDIAVPVNRPFSEFPQRVGTWQMSSQSEFSENVLNVLKPSDYISRQYKGADGKTVNLYIGYHGGGKESGEIHSPKHCLPGSGWFEVSTKRGTLDLPSGKLNLVRSIYQKEGNRELFLYWFQVRDRSISDEYSLKLAEIVNSVLYRRRDASFIRISVAFEDNEQEATELGERFVRDFLPATREFLPS